ncbi:hypothetical protein DP939_28150 [Spongiactinospora rosea]|uniref:Uncharacterized protein n=1 Tax=Spongiactinospora rosea TaxID=2248750 RepID=A0A366LSN1_9ACTN|nr:hypothetical protein [Spongiactinospora rosea]RBQ16931.1 hypothetical protein DP939_28150 [Spongiactinospora rosea]
MISYWCLAPHPRHPQPGYTPLTWTPPRTDTRHRTLAWTCDCQETVYELRASGGLLYITRTRTLPISTDVSETHRLPTREGWDTWHALLAGHAR